MLHSMSDEYRKNDSKRERSFIVLALLVYLRRFWTIRSLQTPFVETDFNLDETLKFHKENVLPVRCFTTQH